MDKDTNDLFKLLGWRPQWSEPCDELGNPINENGTVQAYAMKSDSISSYAIKTYKLKPKHNDK